MASVLLIYPEPEQEKNARFGFSLNLLYLGSILKNACHRVVNYLDFSLQHFSAEHLRSNCRKSDFIIVELDAFSLKRSSNVYHSQRLIQSIKKQFPSSRIIAFGHDLSLFPREVDFADFSIPSDVVNTKILEIIDGPRVEFDYTKNQESFDKLPFPDRCLLSKFIQHGGNRTHAANLFKSTLIETSRGCPNTCVFCQRKGWRKKFIAHSVDYTVSEFRCLQGRNYKNIWIADDNFTFDLNRSKRVLQGLIRNNISKGMKISCSSWSNIDKEFLNLAKSANISIISFGVESANYNILNFYKKKINLDEMRDLIEHADQIGLYTVGNFIIGAPMETEQTIEKTFAYASSTPFDQVNIKTLDYMAGSELFDGLPIEIKRDKRHLFACKENGLNSFGISELIEKINRFKKTFNLSRMEKLKHKIKSFGPPYGIRPPRQ